MAKKIKNKVSEEQQGDDLEVVIPEIIEEEVEIREWMGVPIIALPKKIMHTKVLREQVWRSENVAVYGIYGTYSHKIESYEAFRIMKMPTRMIMGKSYPPAEKVPNDEKWGIYGFDCGSSLEKTMKEYVPRLEALNYNGPKWKTDAGENKEGK